MRRIILFDGICNLCNGSVQFVIQRDPQKLFRLAALQSSSAQRLLTECGVDPSSLPDSLILVEDHTVYVRSDAVLRIGRALPFPWSMLAAAGLWIPRILREPVYQWVARNRYRWFGRRETCRMPQEGDLDRFLTDDPDSP